jgi:hypothetical protein
MTEFAEVINMDEEGRAPAPAARIRQGPPPTAPVEFDDLNDPPGTCSWNPIDWYKEIAGELAGFEFKMTEKRRVVWGEGRGERGVSRCSGAVIAHIPSLPHHIHAPHPDTPHSSSAPSLARAW